MKRAVLLALASLIVAACSSQPPAETPKPGVEERSPGAVTRPGPSTAPVAPQTGVGAQGLGKPGANPLKDPNSPLSKRSVFYDYDSDAIKDEFKPLIQAHAKYLADHGSDKMLIQGNCDERGSREYNLALGQRRSDALKRTLMLLGARDNQIDTVSLGEEKPRCTDQTEQCYAQNRRSDMLYGGEY